MSVYTGVDGRDYYGCHLQSHNMHGFRLGKVDPVAEVLLIFLGPHSVYKLTRYSGCYH